MEWIKVSDRLPLPETLVLVANNESKHPDDNWVCCGEMINKKRWVNQFSDERILVTHWQPLPEPPKD